MSFKSDRFIDKSVDGEYKQGEFSHLLVLLDKKRFQPVIDCGCAMYSLTNIREGQMVTNLPETLSLDSYLSYWRQTLNNRLEELAPPPMESSQRVAAAMNYALQGGHRWRPLFLIAAYEHVGNKNGAEILEAASAVELIHCCSIVLDDLPFIDNNNSLRRNKPPCHLVHGQAETVYASHLLYALAERICAENALRLNVNESLVRAQVTTTREYLVESQVLEINLKNGTTLATKASLSRLYELKSYVFMLAATLAAILGNFDSTQAKLLTGFARSLGLSYQLLDDIQDLDGAPIQMGKPKHMDKDKVNLVSYLGMRRSREFLRAVVFRAGQDLNLLAGNNSFLHELLYKVVLHE
jgi:geranylgeranyl pyrophosphate synthase